MKLYHFVFMSLATMAICSCGDDNSESEKANANGNENGSSFTPTEFVVKGQVEKGPFISGSTINMQPLNQEMKAVGSTYSATITDDAGSFVFSPEKFEQPYARLSVNGYFYNEYQGKLSNGPLTLQSVVDLKDKATVNVNLLTHLKYQRVLNLIEAGKNFKEANSQAQEELFKEFGLQKFNTIDASQFSVAAGTDEAAALIVFSSMLLSNRTEAEFTEYLAKLCSDFSDDGQFVESNKAQIAKDSEELFDKLDDIRKNLIERYKQLGRDIEVNELKYFADWDGNGVAGDEAHDPSKPINLSVESLQVPTEGGTYQITFNSDVPLYLYRRSGEYNTAFSSGMTESGWISHTAEIKNNNTLIITVKPTEYRNVYSEKIYLYDYLDNEVASISMSQNGKPDGKFLSDLGMEAFQRIAHALMNNDVSFFSYGGGHYTDNIRYYLNLCSEEDNSIYHVLLVYRALGLVRAGYGYETIDDIMDWESVLKRAIEVLPNRYVGNCETEEQMASVSADIARYVLANLYSQRGRYSEAQSLVQAIMDNNYYSDTNPIVLGVFGSSIITYQDLQRLLNR